MCVNTWALNKVSEYVPVLDFEPQSHVVSEIVLVIPRGVIVITRVHAMAALAKTQCILRLMNKTYTG